MNDNFENININLPCQRYVKMHGENDTESINKYLQNHCMILKNEGVSDDMIYNSVKILGLYREGVLGYGINSSSQYVDTVLDGYTGKCSDYYALFDHTTPYCYSCRISSLNLNCNIDDEYKIVGYAIRNEQTANEFRNAKYNVELLSGVYVTENVSCSSIVPIKLNYILALYCCEYATGQYDDIYSYIDKQYGSECGDDLRIFMTGYADRAIKMAENIRSKDINKLFEKLKKRLDEKNMDICDDSSIQNSSSEEAESQSEPQSALEQNEVKTEPEKDDEDFALLFFKDIPDDNTDDIWGVDEGSVSSENDKSNDSLGGKRGENPKKTKKKKQDNNLQYDLAAFIKTDAELADISIFEQDEQAGAYIANQETDAEVKDSQTENLTEAENKEKKVKNKKNKQAADTANAETEASEKKSEAYKKFASDSGCFPEAVSEDFTLLDGNEESKQAKNNNHCGLIPNCTTTEKEIRSLTFFLDAFDAVVRSGLENGILNDGCICLELLRDENDVEYYCVYIKTLKKFYSFRCDNDEWVNVIIPFIEQKRFKVVVVSAFNILPVLQRYGIKVRCLYSIQLLYGVVYGNEPLRNPDEMFQFLSNIENIYRKPFPIFALPYCNILLELFEKVLKKNSDLENKFNFFTSLEIVLGGSYVISDFVKTDGCLFSMTRYLEYKFNVVSSAKYDCPDDYFIFSLFYRIKKVTSSEKSDKITHLFKLLVEYERKGLQRGCPIRVLSVSANRIVVAIKKNYEMQLRQFFWLYTEVISVNEYGSGCEIGFDRLN